MGIHWLCRLHCINGEHSSASDLDEDTYAMHSANHAGDDDDEIIQCDADMADRVIIDGGSCNNLASIEMVEKLCLTTTRHPHPYYIQWLNECGKLKISRRVRVHFTLGSYHDYVDCDVIPMQACSLLLGRPWQYDNSVIHHGRTNSYTLESKGQTINLLPMTPNEIVNDDKAKAKDTHEFCSYRSFRDNI